MDNLSEEDLLKDLANLPAGSPQWTLSRDALVEKYVGLIMSIAGAFAKKRNCSHDDLVQAGFLGLLKSIENFDLSRNVKLCTYAYYWIRHEMQRVFGSECFPIRVCSRDVARMHKYKEGFESGDPSALRRRKILAATRIEAAINPVIPLESCDLPSGQHEEEDPFGLSDSRVIIDLLTNKLDSREKKVLFLRHGLDGKGSRTFKEVGKELGITRSRAQQIEALALEKIRCSTDFLLRTDFFEEK